MGDGRAPKSMPHKLKINASETKKRLADHFNLLSFDDAQKGLTPFWKMYI